MQNAYEFNKYEYTEEEMQEIKAENCKTHGQCYEEAQVSNHFNAKACLILFGIFAALYFLMPIIERSILG